MAAPQTKQIIQIFECHKLTGTFLAQSLFNSEILVPAAPQHIPALPPLVIPLVLNISPFPSGTPASSGCSTSCNIPFPQINKSPDLQQTLNRIQSWTVISKNLPAHNQRAMEMSCTIDFPTATRKHKTLRSCCCLALLNTLKQDLRTSILASEMCRFYLEKLLSVLSPSCACSAQKSETGTKEHEQI